MTTPSTCVPCCDPQGLSRHQESYRASHLQILCDLLGVFDGSAAAAEVTALPAVSIPFGNIAAFNAAFVTANPAFLDSNKTLAYLIVNNGTDKAVRISYDAGVSTHLIIPAGQTQPVSFGEFRKLVLAQDLYFRYDTANGTSGAVILEGWY